jgi:hypothetical protein
VRWIVEYSTDLDDPAWDAEDSLEAGRSFQEFEERFVEASDGVPADGYYRIRIDGVVGSTSIYLWGPEARLLLR